MSYDPTVGRWMEQDPAGYIDGPNMYPFEKSNPVDGLDPTGLSDTINSATDALSQYLGGDGRTAQLGDDLINQIKSDWSDYGNAMNDISTQIEKWVDNSKPAPNTVTDVQLSGHYTMVPVDQPGHSTWAFLIGVGTLELDYTATFKLHTSKDDCTGYYSKWVSDISVRWTLHKLYSYNNKPTLTSNVVNYPFQLVLGTICRGTNYWIDGDWFADSNSVHAIYQDPDNIMVKDPKWKPPTTQPTTRPTTQPSP